jgi:hypothetical protein
MSGGETYFRIYYDPKANVFVKANYYQKYSDQTENMLALLELKEKRLTECTCQTQEEKGNTHCVRYSYPLAMTIAEYKFFISIRPSPDVQKWCEGLREAKRMNDVHYSSHNPEQWLWMMDYCKKRGIHPTLGWELAKKAWEEHLATAKKETT